MDLTHTVTEATCNAVFIWNQLQVIFCDKTEEMKFLTHFQVQDCFSMRSQMPVFVSGTDGRKNYFLYIKT